MKQTTVEWIGKELESYGDSQFCKIEWEQLDSLIKQAKEMEKEQLHNIREMLIEGALTNMSCSSAIVEFDKLTFKSE